MKKSLIEFYTRLAHGLAVQFGSNCEVVVHDLQGKDIEHSIIAIENGHVTGRRIGDGPSQIVLESLHNSEQNLKQEDKLAYLTKTKNGKILTDIEESSKINGHSVVSRVRRLIKNRESCGNHGRYRHCIHKE